MNTEDLLTDLFCDQADLRPDPPTVLDAVHERIARQRRATLTRAGGALAAAAAVAAVAVTAATIAAPSGHRADPAAGTAPSTTAPAPSTSAAAPVPSATASDTSTPRPGQPTVAGPGGPSRTYSTINAGYLPGPATQDPAGTSNQPGFEERDWDVTVDGVAMDVIIWTESGPLPARMQATGGGSAYRVSTVNGHRARTFVGHNVSIVAFELGNGTTAYAGPSVQRTTATVTTARITAIAVKVAENMQFDRHDPIPGR